MASPSLHSETSGTVRVGGDDNSFSWQTAAPLGVNVCTIRSRPPPSPNLTIERHSPSSLGAPGKERLLADFVKFARRSSRRRLDLSLGESANARALFVVI